jgi:hypothetical protein
LTASTRALALMIAELTVIRQLTLEGWSQVTGVPSGYEWFGPALALLEVLGPRSVRVVAAAPAASATSKAATSSRLCRIRRLASAISGSSEKGSLHVCAVITPLSLAPVPASSTDRSGVIPEHWPSPVPIHPLKL